MVLDEATSALDTEAEHAIPQSLSELSEGRTMMIIGYRLATIQGADRIVVIDRSGIAEQGTHLDLIARRGAYTRLHSARTM